MLRINC